MPHFLRKMICALILAAPPLIGAPVSAADKAMLKLGKQVFTTQAEPRCTICHTLADAQAVGEIGPNLDDLKPTVDQVRKAVEDGVDAMPAYETLTEEQIDAVALYVSEMVANK